MKLPIRVLETKAFWQVTRCKCPLQKVWLNRNRIAALDIGTNNVGLAISDDYQMNALPVAILKRSSTNGPLTEASLAQLKDVLGENNIKGLVVGMPSNDCEIQQKFLEILMHFHRFPPTNITFWDEAYSSIIARDLLKHALGIGQERRLFGKRERPKLLRRQNLDAMAATVILNEYLSAVERLFY